MGLGQGAATLALSAVVGLSGAVLVGPSWGLVKIKEVKNRPTSHGSGVVIFEEMRDTALKPWAHNPVLPSVLPPVGST